MHGNTRLFHVGLAVRVLGAALLLFVGADHFYEYSSDHYSAIPTIGTLFLLNFIGATAIGVLLLLPVQRILPRLGRNALLTLILGGFAIAATSLTFLLISEHTTVFGFMEANYRTAIVVAIASEAAAAVCLGLSFVLTLKGGKRLSDARKAPATPSGAYRPA
jgi:drug/metabolite transporter (DMT)-like permease